MIKSYLDPKAAEPKAAVTELANAKPGTAGRKRILLVEGDGFTRLVLLLRLRLAGFGVDFTSNGILGLGKLRSCQPDILLVELKLCGMSGLDLIKAARSEPTFGERPIYVFTHTDRMNRATRKEVGLLATELFDKKTITREDLVQIFATTLIEPERAPEQSASKAEPERAVSTLNEVAVSGAIEELIAGVREQGNLFARGPEERAASGLELLSRVSSLGSCAKAAGLPNLARHSKALQNFLQELCGTQPGEADVSVREVTQAIEVMSGMAFEKAGKERGPARFNAVYVDEAPLSNRAMEEALLDAAFEPVCFENPAQAREHLEANRADLIIANLVLPEAHGLAVADIRKLPQHSKTPVLFAPELPAPTAMRGDLPMSSPRLDKASLWRKELVLRALNEVQSARKQATSPSPVAAPPAPAQSSAPASLLAEDDFVLFAQAPGKEPAVRQPVMAQSVAVTAAATPVRQSQSFDQIFAAAGIPSEPIMRVQPMQPDSDREAEMTAVLPENFTDGSQAEDQTLEAPPISALEAEPPPNAQPEATADDQPFVANSTASPLEQNEAATAEESAAAIQNDGELMNNQLQSAPAESAAPDSSQPGEASNGQRTPRQDLIARVCEAEMALYRAQMEIEQRDKALEELQGQLEQAQAGQPREEGAAAQPTQARCAELEEEVVALRQALEGLNGNFAEQQPAESGKQVAELEERLSQKDAELNKLREEQQSSEGELRRQLREAGESGQQAAAARQQAEARCAQLEQELTAARKAAQQPVSPAAPGQHPETGAGAGDFEQQLRQNVAALARATAELARERGERQRSQQLAADLNSRLQALHGDLSRTLQAQGENLTRINTLEQEHNQANQALERCKADLEEQEAERRLAEEQLQKAKDANAQLRKDVAFFDDANNKFDGARQELEGRLETTLSTRRETEARLQQETKERQRLAQSLEEAQRELQNHSRTHESLERELQTTRQALQESEARLHKETAERQRLDESRDSQPTGAEANPERDLEFSKLRSALQLEQVERKRQESQLARTRQSALDAAHAARALRATMRRQIREPVDNLVQSTRSLLELEMDEDQKKLAEAVLQDVLLVQTRLREPGPASGDAEPTAPAANSDS